MNLAHHGGPILLAALLLGGRAGAAVDFDGIACEQKDIAKALVGREMTNAKVAALERKYRKLQLKDLGAETIGDESSGTNLVYWQLCGRNVVVLVDGKLVSDAIEFPAGAKEPDSKLCKNQQQGDDTVVRMLKPSGEVEKAWRVDRKTKKLEAISAAGLVCSD